MYQRQSHFRLAAIAIGMVAFAFISRGAGSAPAYTPFDGAKTNWHGFDRYDFVLNESDLSVSPFTASPNEPLVIPDVSPGHRHGIIVVPKSPAPGAPWSWRGCYWNHQPQAEIELLRRGFHIAFVSGNPDKGWDDWHAYVTEKHGLSKKPAFIGMSRGGFNEYVWATAHPDCVSCIYADNPAVSRDSLLKIPGLASNNVPLLHICGSLDPFMLDNSFAVEGLYQTVGGRVSLMIKEGFGHHPHSLKNPNIIADFMTASQNQPVSPLPSYVGSGARDTYFYGNQSVYRDFLADEGTYITCRGPIFSGCYHKYEFRVPAATGSVKVVAPQKTAEGKPWVYRADFVRRDASVDLALLDKGFFIVTGPAPTSVDDLVMADWNKTYDYLVSNGFSKKPALEGDGRAGGEAYAWAIANPDKVSCIYGENPVLKATLSHEPILDGLPKLAQANIPLLHVCGTADPFFNDSARVLESKYKELGGRITIIVKPDAGHYPLSPADPVPVVDFIVNNSR